jgi:hypothetical protein
MKSKSIWNASLPAGTSVVVRPRGVTMSVEFHQWFMSGVIARRILPTTWVHMWTAWTVSFNSAYASDGHNPTARSVVAISDNSPR